MGTVQKTWFGHPAGLTILFLTQTWEQFSYYGMRAIVVYYMLSDLMMSQAQSSMIFGVYVAFFYLTPMLGGIAADRWLGRRRAIILGGEGSEGRRVGEGCFSTLRIRGVPMN